MPEAIDKGPGLLDVIASGISSNLVPVTVE
jgi:hypothetical protein